jgi:hypothetical protein
MTSEEIMNPNLMACLSDSFHLLREYLDRMAGNKPAFSVLIQSSAATKVLAVLSM